jgi:TRAP transporter TAXI family solute receptor
MHQRNLEFSPTRRPGPRWTRVPAGFLRAVLPLVLLALIAPVARAADAPRDTLRLATGSVGGTFLPVGRELAAWWAKTVPDVVVLVDTTAGSVENLDRLVDGEADLAIVGASPFREVVEGRRSIADEAKRICTIGSLYDDAEQYVVRKSLVRVGNLLDLNGLLMYPGPHNSGGEIDTRLILSVLEVEPRYVYVEDRDKGYSAAATALVRGEFDAATFSGGVPIQAVTDLLDLYPNEYVILPFSRHMLNKLRYHEKDFTPVTIHAGAYPGLTKNVRTVGGSNLLVACPRLDPAIVAKLDRAVRKGIATPGKGLRAKTSHPVLQVLDLQRWNQVPVGERCAGAISAGIETSP